MSLPPPVLCVVIILIAGLAAIYDLRSRRIPNWISLSGAILGLSLNASLAGWFGLRAALLGAGFALLVYVPLYMLRGMGAGDVKLMAAMGSLVGPANWIYLFMLTAITGGLVALVVITTRGGVGKTLRNIAVAFRQLASFRAPYAANPALDITHPKAATLPHAAVIAAGALEFLILGAWGPQPR